MIELSRIKMRFHMVSQSVVRIVQHFGTPMTPAECAEPAAPECVVGEDAVDVAAPHTSVITPAAIDLVTGSVSTLPYAHKIRCSNCSSRSAHMNLVAGDRRI